MIVSGKGSGFLSLRPRRFSLGHTYFYDSAATLDRVLGNEEPGFSYARYANPTNEALEELTTSLEAAFGRSPPVPAWRRSRLRFQAALVDRPHIHPRFRRHLRRHGRASSIRFFEPFGVRSITSTSAISMPSRRPLRSIKPAAVFIETISNPLLRVGNIRDCRLGAGSRSGAGG